MQAQFDPMLEILPFDDKYAVRAHMTIQKQSQKLFVTKTFLMFVLEIRSAMDERDINMLKGFILDTCTDLLERGGIDNVGFVINSRYHTIRNPNYEGIKDLLNMHVEVSEEDTGRETLRCLRDSIHLEAKKLESANISIMFFNSHEADNPLNPKKKPYRRLKNQHTDLYQKELSKLKKTITSMCDSCKLYFLGYVKKSQGEHNQMADYSIKSTEMTNSALWYSLSQIGSRSQFCFYISDTYQQLADRFKQVSALMCYQFHQFHFMVPVCGKRREKEHFQPDEESFAMLTNQNKQQKQEEDLDIEFEELEQFFKAQRQKALNEKEQAANEQQSEEEEQIEYMPKQQYQNKTKYAKLTLVNSDETKFATQAFTYFSKPELDLKELHDNGYHILKKVDYKLEACFPVKKRVMRNLRYVYTPERICKEVNYREPDIFELIRCQSEYYQWELRQIIGEIMTCILSYKKRYVGTLKKTRIFQTYLVVNEEKQNQLRNRVHAIQNIVKEVYDKIFADDQIKQQRQKAQMFELYSNLKKTIDYTLQVFVSIFKKQIKNQDLCKLSTAMNYANIRSSLKRKLIKRINANPNMLNQVYARVEEVCEKGITDYVELEARNVYAKSEVGNCMYTSRNFATALKAKDCLGVIFELERPDAAIADPGRIRIRQVSDLVTCVSKFFEVHLYEITQPFNDQGYHQQAHNDVEFFSDLWLESQSDYIEYEMEVYRRSVDKKYRKDAQFRQAYEPQQQIKAQKQKFGIRKEQYQQNWDYWNRVEQVNTFFGMMPLYVCEENWAVAKQLMKPCMAWTACAEPMGYAFVQMQTIPFMVQSSFIRAIQELKYKIAGMQKQYDRLTWQKEYELRHQANILIRKLVRYEELLKHVELTCNAIMRDMSSPKFQLPLDKSTIEKYVNYSRPINRTVDVINNNSSFLSQLYTVITMGRMEKPSKQQFHEFFIRLVEQELRRETYGWYEEEDEENFINNILNVKVEEMTKPAYMVMESEYLDKFESALAGQQVLRTEFQIQRDALEMIIKQNNKFNDNQRLAIIEYKRLYENRVLWLWYIVFRLYGEEERVHIHKWKSVGLMNSYQLFTMIIQNKKQRRNHKRRKAILDGEYVDPFDYYQAREYLEQEFVKMRNKQQARNIVLLNSEKYGKASQVFARTKDIREAAGAILNIELGREIAYYYQQLFHDPFAIEQKLKILLNGEYMGVRLFKHGWKMSKKRMQNLRQRYPLEFMRYQYMF